MSDLILHPKTVALRKKVEALREELASLLRERMHLTFDELPALRYRYTEIFGQLEREIEQKTLEMSERKRLVELFALKLDRGQKLDQKLVELTMKAVFNEFRKLRGQVERISRKEESRPRGDGFRIPGFADTQTTSDPEVRREHLRREIRDLYRKLAKRFHPDRAGDGDQLTRTYWEMTQRGYIQSDIDLLRTLSNVVETDVGSIVKGTIASPAEEAVQLIEIIDREKRYIAEMNQCEPYNIREKLNDEKWVVKKKSGLEDQIAALKREIEKCDRFLAPIIGNRAGEVDIQSVQKTWNSFVEDVYLSGRF
ncbi:MAG: hypothetical protein AB7H80_05835 [Candidatus Kapaibacterium sp.]